MHKGSQELQLHLKLVSEDSLQLQEAKPDTLFTLHSDYSFCKITEHCYLATMKSKSTLQHLLCFLNLPLLHAIPVLPIQAPSPQADASLEITSLDWEVESPTQKTMKNFTGSKAPMSSPISVRIPPGLNLLSCS